MISLLYEYLMMFESHTEDEQCFDLSLLEKFQCGKNSIENNFLIHIHEKQ